VTEVTQAEWPSFTLWCWLSIPSFDSRHSLSQPQQANDKAVAWNLP
jgi:hypothetical protein